ncbi:MAG: hydrogenase maturation nickel metallochaperone HypA [Ruminococcaceae bacterium]|nr:hydrogenase maturation nickel metallochaperone HypA [Oscillospiraceae bacterium]
MHEIGIVRAMAKTVTDYAEANGIDKVAEIVLDIGELSLVIPEYVEELYAPVVQGTFLEDTKLIINIVPGMAVCDNCDDVFNVVEHEGYCPNCGSFDKEVLSGQEFLIREIHVDEAEEGEEETEAAAEEKSEA